MMQHNSPAFSVAGSEESVTPARRLAGRPVTVRFEELDALRFFAALSVVFYHYCFRGFTADGLQLTRFDFFSPLARYGYLGVDLFFLISGFVISMSAAGKDARQFVAGRFIRLYPAYWMACLLTFTVTWGLGAEKLRVDFSNFAVNLTMLQSYFSVRHVDEVYWSLVVEMKFYCLIALLCWGKWIHHLPRLLVLWLGATVLERFVVHLPGVSALLFPDWSSYFIGGTALFLATQARERWKFDLLAFVSMLVAIKGAAVDRVATLSAHYGAGFSPWVIGGAVVLSYTLLWAVSFRLYPRWNWRLWATFGALTYPLYLIHQNIGYTLIDHLSPLLGSSLGLVGTVLIVLLGAFGIYSQIELPAQRYLKRILLPAHIVK
jgi:peptidoglycan/LPS O-acetylase OafA/YrhL